MGCRWCLLCGVALELLGEDAVDYGGEGDAGRIGADPEVVVLVTDRARRFLITTCALHSTRPRR